MNIRTLWFIEDHRVATIFTLKHHFQFQHAKINYQSYLSDYTQYTLQKYSLKGFLKFEHVRHCIKNSVAKQKMLLTLFISLILAKTL